MTAAAGGGDIAYVTAFPVIFSLDLQNQEVLTSSVIYDQSTTSFNGDWATIGSISRIIYGGDDKIHGYTNSHIFRLNPADFSIEAYNAYPSTNYNGELSNITWIDGTIYTSNQSGTTSLSEFSYADNFTTGNASFSSPSGFEDRGYHYAAASNGGSRIGQAALKYTNGFNGFDFNDYNITTDNDNIQGVRDIFYYNGYWYGPDIQNGTWYVADGSTTATDFYPGGGYGQNFLLDGLMVLTRNHAAYWYWKELSSSGPGTTQNVSFPYGPGTDRPNYQQCTALVKGLSTGKHYIFMNTRDDGAGEFTPFFSWDPNDPTTSPEFLGDLNWTNLIEGISGVNNIQNVPETPREIIGAYSKASEEWDAA